MDRRKRARLAAEAAQGDTQAFSQLYGEIYKKLYYYALSNLRSPHDAADAVQDAVLDAYSGIGGLKNAEAFDKWMFTILSAKIRQKQKEYTEGRLSLQELDEGSPAVIAEEGGFVPCPEADSDAPGFWRWMQILARACALAPERRYRSAKALRKEISALALRVALRARVWPWVRRVLGAAALVAFGFLLARAFAPVPVPVPGPPPVDLGELFEPEEGGNPFDSPAYRIVDANGDISWLPVHTQKQLDERQRFLAEQTRRIEEDNRQFLERLRRDLRRPENR